MELTTKVSTTFIVAAFAVLMSTNCVAAQSISSNTTILSPNGSVIASLTIIANTTTNSTLLQNIQTLINATKNATSEIGKIIADAANRTIANGNITVQNIQNFLQIVETNISRINNATVEDLKAAVANLRQYVQNNRELIQTRINLAINNLVNVLISIISAFNNVTNVSLPTFPTLRPPTNLLTVLGGIFG